MRKYKFAEEREVEYIKVTKENIGGKHICCAISFRAPLRDMDIRMIY